MAKERGCVIYMACRAQLACLTYDAQHYKCARRALNISCGILSIEVVPSEYSVFLCAGDL